MKARDPAGLRRAMLEVNFKARGQAKFFDIQQDKDGNWYAWYFDEIPIDDLLRTLNGASSKR